MEIKNRPLVNLFDTEHKVNTGKYSIEHLLVLPVPYRKDKDELLIEFQAHHGLHRWLDSFDNLALAAPLIPEYLANEKREVQWVRPDSIIIDKVKLVPLPWAYRPDHFIRALRGTLTLLDSLICDSRYLQFAISGLWGDWAAVAAEIAIRRNRVYAIHTDNVCHEYTLRLTKKFNRIKRFRVCINIWLMKYWHMRIIAKCNLGLFHGMDTYKAYKSWIAAGRTMALVHNIHDIPKNNLNESCKCSKVGVSKVGQIHIIYAGRVAPEKAPLDWINALKMAHTIGAEFRATWAGDGQLFNELQHAIQLNQLSDIISLPGFIASRADIANLYTSADLFVFTHITPESPRCLIEALSFGIPIIGYYSTYAHDLIEGHGGGVLVPCNDWRLLAKLICDLTSNPAVPDISSRPVFRGYEGIGFRKLFGSIA